jgi:hypothetical protein
VKVHRESCKVGKGYTTCVIPSCSDADDRRTLEFVIEVVRFAVPKLR